VHQRCSYWLWSWVDPVLKKIKYVYPDPSSLNHSLQERDKFEAARRLKGVIRNIREEYVRVLSTPDADPGRVEFAMILLLIDRLGLRIGNTGSQTGASTLRKEHVQIFPERKKIRVSFVGKDSIPYDQTMYADGVVLRAMKKLLGTPGEDLFPTTTSRDINQYLQTIHPDLKAKVFRTYNASEIFQAYLQKNTKGGMGNGELVGVFKGAGMTVAQFCNHRRLSTLNKLSDKFAPSTSITNYVDPRIGVSWAKRNHVPLPQIYSKNLIKRFDWALDTGEDFSW
jgi:DNA topoisomerase I